MKPQFSVRIGQFSILDALPGTWDADDSRAILAELEFETTAETSAAELWEFCIMSLQDLEPAAAAEVLLRYRLGRQLSAGQISNMAGEMRDEKLWEEYADFSLHEQLFNIASVLHCVSTVHFPEPDAVALSIEVTADNEPARQVLAQPLSESFLVRLLADGMDERAVLHRLFGEQLSGDHFAAASSIVWTVESSARTNASVTVDLISSGYWLNALRDTRSFSSNAYADEDP